MRVTCLLIVLMASSSLGCGREKVVNSAISGKELDALRASLAKLEETLKTKSPFVFAKLAPAATDDEIKTLWNGLDGAQVQSLEVWYRWHNGCEGQFTDVLPLGRMLSIAEAIEDRKQIQTVPFVDAKRKSALKILEDGAGDGFFLDIASTRLRVFYHMLEDPYPRDYGTLEQFVTFIRDVHEAGLAKEKKDGMVEFDLKGYQTMEAEYFKRIGSARE
jgi:hypothetical protein